MNAMNIKDVRYSPLLQENMLAEQLDDLTRYLRLCGEFGCTEEGEAVFRRLQESLAQAGREMQRLVCSAADPQEPDELDAIRALRPNGPRAAVAQPAGGLRPKAPRRFLRPHGRMHPGRGAGIRARRCGQALGRADRRRLSSRGLLGRRYAILKIPTISWAKSAT